MVEAGAGAWMTLAEAAATTGRNPELLRRWCVAGRLPCRRVGRDWIIAAGDISAVERMPRRGEARRSVTPALDDLSLLPSATAAAISECLEPGEGVRVVALGVEDSALVATDSRVFVVRDGAPVTESRSGVPASWPLKRIRRIQLESGTASGALILTPADPDGRALVVVLARPHLARASAAAPALRDLLAAAGSYGSDATPG
jgi:hypothetical protein